MSTRVSKINFSQPNAQAYNEKICYYYDGNELQKISIQTSETDSFENYSKKVDEINLKTAISALLGGIIGFFISRNQRLLSKIVMTSIGIFTGIGISAYSFAKDLIKEREKNLK